MPHQRVAADRLHRFSVSVFKAAGAPHEHAVRAADVLIWASLRGVDTHGIRNLKRYYLDASGVGRRDGAIVMDAELTLDCESETAAEMWVRLRPHGPRSPVHCRSCLAGRVRCSRRHKVALYN